MKKILLSSTALLSAAVLASGAHADAPSASLSGKVTRDIQWYDSDINGSSKNAGWNIQAAGYTNEFYIAGNGSTDDGLTYGAKIDTGFGASNAIDEAYIHIGGDWGTIHLGEDDGAAGNNYVDGSSVLSGTGGWDGRGNLALSGLNNTSATAAADPTTSSAAVTAVAGFTDTNGVGGAIGPNPSVSGDDNKIAYYAPSLAGINLSASITPASGRWQNITELGANYSFGAGDASVTVKGSYSSATANSGANRNNASYNFGAIIGFGPISIGAGFTDKGTTGATGSPATDQGGVYSVGVGYDVGGGTSVSAGIARATRTNDVATDAAAGDARTKANATWYQLGLSTSIAPGMSAFAEFNYASHDTGITQAAGVQTSNNPIELLVGTSVSF